MEELKKCPFCGSVSNETLQSLKDINDGEKFRKELDSLKDSTKPKEKMYPFSISEKELGLLYSCYCLGASNKDELSSYISTITRSVRR